MQENARITSGSLNRNSSMCSRYRNELDSRSFMLPPSVWLIVYYGFVGNVCFNIAYDVASYLVDVTRNHDDSCFYVASTEMKSIVPSFVQFTMVNALLFCLYPLTGWLADTLIGYDRTVSVSLWLCWLGSIVQCLNYSVRYALVECSVPVVFKYTLSSVTFVLLSIGSTGLYTILPVYGLGQLSDKPNSCIRAFIKWFVVGIFVSSLANMSFVSIEWSLVCCVCAVLFSSVAICLHGQLYFKFEKVGVRKKNPYKSIVNVLRYAYTHSEVGKRSSFTYWEESIPSRVNLGKTKYGGPFEDKEVEDVKRFWRILSLLLCTFGFYISYYATVYNAYTFVGNAAGLYLWNILDSSIIFIIPIVELVAIPCWPKLEYFLSSPLKGIGLTYLLNILTLTAMFVIEFFNTQMIWYFTIPFLLSGLVHGLSFIYGIQFICSQAPADMSGMLLGIFWFFHAVFVNIGCFTFRLPISDQWTFLLLLLISWVGFVVFVVVARWYRSSQYEIVYDAYNNISAVFTQQLAESSDYDRNNSIIN